MAPLREGGSLPAVVEADDDGLYVAKFRGAGHGVKALVAEVIAGEIGRALGLLVPEIVLLDFDPRLAAAEPDQEIRELLQRSSGVNVGLDFLPGSLGFDPAASFAPPPDLCAAVVWFDSFVTNVDRDARNTNMLVWHRRLWLIDHGSALHVHHTWKDAAAHARKPLAALKSHVLLPRSASILGADERSAVGSPGLGGGVAGVRSARVSGRGEWRLGGWRRGRVWSGQLWLGRGRGAVRDVPPQFLPDSHQADIGRTVQQ